MQLRGNSLPFEFDERFPREPLQNEDDGGNMNLGLVMKRIAAAVGLSALLIFAVACKKQQNDADAIRAGIMQHLSSVGTLNLNAMEMDIHNISINGSQARAEVEFRAKTGGPPGSGMQVAYNLEKRDGAWVVLKTQAAGGTMQHPDPNQTQQKQNVHPGSLPNFEDLLNPGAGSTQGQLPPGHPPINPKGTQEQSSDKKLP
jgi:hypothetical protein